jgi:hypothetical protein
MEKKGEQPPPPNPDQEMAQAKVQTAQIGAQTAGVKAQAEVQKANTEVKSAQIDLVGKVIDHHTNMAQKAADLAITQSQASQQPPEMPQ